MPENLSQNQIDELLRKLTGRAAEEEQGSASPREEYIKLYNFKNPKRMTKDQQRVLRGIGEIFARHLASYLAGLTRSYCEVNVVSLEEKPYMEYNSSLPDMQISGVVDMSILKGAMLLDLSNPLTFALIERMFGGAIEAQPVPVREFTDIEAALMERILRRVLSLFQEAWTYCPNLTVSLRQIETNTRFIKAIPMDEVVVVMTLAVKVNTVKGTITCCIPCMDVSPTLNEIFSAQVGKSNRTEPSEENSEETQMALLGQLKGSDMELCTILGTTTVNMQEMVNLRPGDVIRLDQPLGSQVMVLVNGEKWFTGEPRTIRNKIAVLIKRQIAG